MNSEKSKNQSLKRSLASLKGWLKRRHVTILTTPRPGSNSVEYEGRYFTSTAWYVSPGGMDDAELVQKYMEKKTKLEELSVR